MTDPTTDRSAIGRNLPRMTALLERLASPAGGSVRVVRAPGRVNLIGEYTDVNQGWVLPAAIDLEVWIALEAWDLPEVELTSIELGETRRFRFADLSPEHEGARPWIDYVAGTAWAMREAGLPIKGFRGVLSSTVPVGSGLSSSAAVEMATTWALADPAAARPQPGAMALIAQRAENRYVGVQCGIMDQYASAAGQRGMALLIDTRSNEFRPVPVPDDLSIVVCDTRAPRRLDGSAYNARRTECETGARIIAEHEPAVRTLRDVDKDMLARYRHLLPETVARRCDHIVNEDDRVLETVAALSAGDHGALGRLFAASHNSLRDLFEVSSKELDVMVEIAGTVPGVVASRMTGAGFGGCTVSLVRRGSEDELRNAVMRDYPARTGLTPAVHMVDAVDGAGPVDTRDGLAGR